MRTKLNPGDRTGRWLVLQRYGHKDGGYFWSLCGFAEGVSPDEALTALLAKSSILPARKFAVLDWTTAKVFSNIPNLTEDAG